VEGRRVSSEIERAFSPRSIFAVIQHFGRRSLMGRARGHIMNIQHYRDLLLDFEKNLSARTDREIADGRREFIDSAHDVGDASVADAAASEKFIEADRDSMMLKQVREALARVKAGTFGTCIVDGGPIEQKRLDAAPWTPYCLQHEQLLEASSPSKTPTL
jgi:DnaK suppressor protein